MLLRLSHWTAARIRNARIDFKLQSGQRASCWTAPRTSSTIIMNDIPPINPAAFLRRRRILDLRAALRDVISVLADDISPELRAEFAEHKRRIEYELHQLESRDSE